MRLNLIDLFKKITWAKNGDLTDFSQTNYEAGWAHLGDDTPTVQDFNYVQQMNDKKDQWLFNQLKSVLDQAGIEATEKNVTALRDAILMLSKGYSQPKDLNAETVNFIDETGHTHEIAKASLEQAGLVQLSSEINSDDETKAPTLKVVKKLKSLYDGLRKLLDSYIPNSKKSSRVDSNSADDVATSAAVKTAYDKAVSADDNANGRVSKAGDTMTGTLTIIGNAKKYKLGKFSWRKALDFSGDTLIGNEITCIAFNNNGQLHLGGKPNASEANAHLDESMLLVKGDVRTLSGHSLNNAFDKTAGGAIKGFVEIRQGDWSGLNLFNNADRYLRIEGNPDSADSMLTFVYRNTNGGNIETAHLPKRSGKIAFANDVVADIRLGAKTRHQLWRSKGFDGELAGYVVTGVINDGNDEPDVVVVRPIQKKINNQWVTISNT